MNRARISSASAFFFSLLLLGARLPLASGADPRQDLASPSQAVRDAAAAALRSTYKPSPADVWDALIQRISTDSTVRDVEAMLPGTASPGTTIGSRDKTTHQYRLDDTFLLTVTARNEDGRVLQAAAVPALLTVLVPPPADLTGRWTLYYVNGQKSLETDYAQGEADGDEIKYDEAGRERLRALHSRGKDIGRWIWYDDEGLIEATVDHGSHADETPRDSAAPRAP